MVNLRGSGVALALSDPQTPTKSAATRQLQVTVPKGEEPTRHIPFEVADGVSSSPFTYYSPANRL
jgi:hypothetical protein